MEDGLIIEDEKIIQKILEIKNEKIVNCVYNHIGQIHWKHNELLIFLKKNDLKTNINIEKMLYLG